MDDISPVWSAMEVVDGNADWYFDLYSKSALCTEPDWTSRERIAMLGRLVNSLAPDGVKNVFGDELS